MSSNQENRLVGRKFIYDGAMRLIIINEYSSFRYSLLDIESGWRVGTIGLIKEHMLDVIADSEFKEVDSWV